MRSRCPYTAGVTAPPRRRSLTTPLLLSFLLQHRFFITTLRLHVSIATCQIAVMNAHPPFPPSPSLALPLPLLCRATPARRPRRSTASRAAAAAAPATAASATASRVTGGWRVRAARPTCRTVSACVCIPGVVYACVWGGGDCTVCVWGGVGVCRRGREAPHERQGWRCIQEWRWKWAVHERRGALFLLLPVGHKLRLLRLRSPCQSTCAHTQQRHTAA